MSVPMRLRRNRIVLFGFVALAWIWLIAASRVYVNSSWSDNAWGYFVVPMSMPGIAEPGLGDLVVFEPPAALGAKAPYLKTVRGVAGDEIVVDGDRWVRIDGELLGQAKPFALDGRPLEPVATGIIPPDHFFVHAYHVDSHDSRYAEIGLVPEKRILGRAARLPNFPWLGLEGPLLSPDAARPGSSRAETRP